MTAAPKLHKTGRPVCRECGDMLCTLLNKDRCRELDAPKCKCGDEGNPDLGGCCSVECLEEARRE